MKSKTGQIASGLGLLSLSLFLGACASPPVRVSEGDVDRAGVASAGYASNESVHSSQWARVLPAPVVNGEPLAMVEYNPEYARNDAALGVVTGPAGQPLAYYASPQAPSLFWQTQFTLSQTSNTVTVFGRPSDFGWNRPYSGYYRNPW